MCPEPFWLKMSASSWDNLSLSPSKGSGRPSEGAWRGLSDVEELSGASAAGADVWAAMSDTSEASGLQSVGEEGAAIKLAVNNDTVEGVDVAQLAGQPEDLYGLGTDTLVDERGPAGRAADLLNPICSDVAEYVRWKAQLGQAGGLGDDTLGEEAEAIEDGPLDAQDALQLRGAAAGPLALAQGLGPSLGAFAALSLTPLA